MKRTLTAALAAGTLAAGTLLATAPASAGAPAAAPAPPRIVWQPCASGALKAAPAPQAPAPQAPAPQAAKALQAAKAECGRLTVPLDAAHPGAGTVTLALSRVRHTVPAARYKGVMLTNPGGPGASGLGLSTLGADVPKNVGAAYDWIGFDPRGVGQSTPSLNCDPHYQSFDRPNYLPIPMRNERVWLQRTKGYTRACAPYRNLLAHLKTTDTVADMESIRTALGANKISFYGFSYGTYLGQVYATQHPDRVARMVLDSNVDPRRIWYQANLDQNVAFERNINIWFAWVARHNDVYKLGTTARQVRTVWFDQLPKLDRKPAGGKVGPDEWTDIFLQAGYYRSSWTGLGTAFANWIHKGDATTLVDLYASNDTAEGENGYAMYNAVQCTDVQWPTDWNRWRVDNWRSYAIAPFNTWGNAWFNAPCTSWPAKAGTPVKVTGAKAPPILLIDETLDAATPYEGSLEVRSRFPKAALIAEPGGMTHADSLYGNACVDDKIADYLATGALPARRPGRTADTTCAPLPDPTPKAPAPQAPGLQLAPRSLPAQIPGRLPAS